MSEFIERLDKYDADFKKIKPSLRKPSYPFCEAIRVHLKNKITKINKEIEESGKVGEVQEFTPVIDTPAQEEEAS